MYQWLRENNTTLAEKIMNLLSLKERIQKRGRKKKSPKISLKEVRQTSSLALCHQLMQQ